MAVSATLLNLHQLADAALIGPELGTVNFRLLHTVIQIIINQLGIDDIKIEFTGNESELLQKMVDPNTSSGIRSTQYNITSQSGKVQQGEQGKSKQLIAVDTGEQELKVIDRRKDSHQEPAVEPGRFEPPPPSNVVIVPTSSNKELTPAFTVAMTKETFDQIVEDIEDLKDKYKELTVLANNSDLMNAVKNNASGGKGTIVDMYQLLSLSKRIEALEIGITKMASMIEDLAREQMELEVSPSSQVEATSSKVIEGAVKLRASIDNGQSLALETLKGIEKRMGELEHMVASGLADITKGTHLPKLSDVAGPVIGEDFSRTDLTKLNVSDALLLIQQECKNIRNVILALDVPTLQQKVDSLKKDGGTRGTKPGAGGDMSERMAQVEFHYNQCVEQINALNTSLQARMETIDYQVASLEDEVEKLNERLHGMTEHGGIGASDNVMDLYKKYNYLESTISNITQTSTELVDERNERQLHFAALKEQIEMLKTVKADKCEVESQLAEKVDVCMINRKVSHEQFDATCTDLTKGIEDALDKLTKQEELWQQALSDIQTEVGAKLDKMELGPLKEFITHKLTVLQSKLKALSKLKKEQEAAGTKAALLRDVKCISCDQKVVMRKNIEPGMYPQPPSLPPTRTMAPYLAYELDQLRKQQRTLASGRNLNHFEQIKKGDTYNRYCGGSHTLTTPQQRVTRLGHFLEQWGPEIAMANDAEIKGKDGMIYRGEEKSEDPQVARSSSRTARPSIVVQGDILANRPVHEVPEKLSGAKSPKPGGVSFTENTNPPKKE